MGSGADLGCDAVRSSRVVDAIVTSGIVAVVRCNSERDWPSLATALADGGVSVVEITLTVPRALTAIEQVVDKVGNRVTVGAGTVADSDSANRAIAAGAEFVVGPSFNREVITAAQMHDVAAIPGCLTPTEIVDAWAAGADIVKAFPGRVVTPEYCADLRGPLPHVRLMPTGGVDLGSAPRYIQAGAVAVGVGNALIDSGALESEDWEAITGCARRFRKVIDEAKGR